MNDEEFIAKLREKAASTGQYLFIIELTTIPPTGEPYVLSRGMIPTSVDPNLDQNSTEFRHELVELAAEGLSALVEANKETV